MKDPVLKSFPFDQASFVEIVYRVIKSGTVLERAALAKHLTPKSASFFPSIKTQIGDSKEILTAAIEDIFYPMFRRLTDHFGVPFNGDQESVAYSLISEFGGLSFADFLIFFERAKTGRYRLEYQHVATRGINADFLFSWLEQYVEDKVAEVDDMYNQFKNPKSFEAGDKDTAERIREYREAQERRKKERLALENEAEKIRGEFEQSVYQTAILKQWFKWSVIQVPVFDTETNGIKTRDDGTTVTHNQKKEVICDENDPNKTRFEMFPIRVAVPGGIERLLKRAIFEFVKFGESAETVTFFEDYKDRVWKKYSSENDQAGHVEAEFKIALGSISQIKRIFTAERVIEDCVRKTHPNANQKQIAKCVADTLVQYEDFYYTDYLPLCIERNYPALKKKDYILSQVLPTAISSGFVNPINAVFE